MAYIYVIQQFSSSVFSLRYLLKIKNVSILSFINKSIKDFKLSVQFIKVQAHLGEFDNDRADLLAKKSGSSNFC